MTTVLISAGDASGEAHSAGLVRALRIRLPDARFVGLGGPRMQAAGVELIADQSALAIGGGLEIAGSLGRIIRTWYSMTHALRELQPELVVLVDSGGFNLPFARHVRARSNAPILYFIAPQVWAWRTGRLRKLVARTDRIAVLFPFEADFYRDRGVEVEFVGHPYLDGPIASPVVPETRVKARQLHGFDATAPLLGIFPGSRRNEITSHLPRQLAAFARLRERVPGLADLEAVVGLAPSLDPDWIRSLARETGIVGPVRFEPGGQTIFDAIDVAVTKPGSVTVELMLRERPMVVVGRIHPLTAAIASLSAQVSSVAMPNLIAGKVIVPELLQGDATPDRIAASLAPLFADPMAALAVAKEPTAEKRVPSPAARNQIEALRRARSLLGLPGATARTAQLVEEMLGTAAS